MMGIVSSLYCPSLRPNDGQCYLVTDVIVYLTFYKKYPVKNFELYLLVSKKAVSLQRSNKNKLKDDMKQEKLNSLIISLNIILLWGQDRK